jgi:hypothetical protein
MTSQCYCHVFNADPVTNSLYEAIDHRAASGPPLVLHAIPIANTPFPGTGTRGHVTINVDDTFDGQLLPRPSR